eukprot:gnl/MRDRNA2_/MRDRNA2_77923_c0_seq1.p1 gnl/MRDRNA2_/MRDRNA2_77923_c0~~gnl/MRDRNA2_/MRDRNA2_77923_c0_seq1.p1  ORF type:complete len:449 (+),score=83.61 gnl/MRDRNA2_/MRDRNA2_77923_c0_seq1:96-1442(+)
MSIQANLVQVRRNTGPHEYAARIVGFEGDYFQGMVGNSKDDFRFKVQILDQAQQKSWIVSKTFEEFQGLDKGVRYTLQGGQNLPTLPPQSTFFRKTFSKTFNRERQEGCDRFIQAVMNMDPSGQNMAVKSFIGTAYPAQLQPAYASYTPPTFQAAQPLNPAFAQAQAISLQSGQVQAAPVQAQAVVVQSQPAPVQAQVLTAQSQPAIVQAAPIESQVMHAQVLATPAQSQSAPLQAQAQASPVQSWPTPVPVQAIPAQSQPAPAPATPVQAQPAIVQAQAVQVQAQAPPPMSYDPFAPALAFQAQAAPIQAQAPPATPYDPFAPVVTPQAPYESLAANPSPTQPVQAPTPVGVAPMRLTQGASTATGMSASLDPAGFSSLSGCGLSDMMFFIRRLALAKGWRIVQDDGLKEFSLKTVGSAHDDAGFAILVAEMDKVTRQSGGWVQVQS